MINKNYTRRQTLACVQKGMDTYKANRCTCSYLCVRVFVFSCVRMYVIIQLRVSALTPLMFKSKQLNPHV